jgi:hypothetical protein
VICSGCVFLDGSQARTRISVALAKSERWTSQYQWTQAMVKRRGRGYGARSVEVQAEAISRDQRNEAYPRTCFRVEAADPEDVGSSTTRSNTR